MMAVVFLLFLPLMAVAKASRDEMVEMGGYGEVKLSTVLVTGTLLCHLHPHAPWPISGALVDVKCKRKWGSAEGRTDEYGDFVIDLPSHLHGVPNLEKICRLQVLGIPKKSMCRPAFVKRHKRLSFSSIGNGIRIYTAGKIRFRHITSKPFKSCITNTTTNGI